MWLFRRKQTPTIIQRPLPAGRVSPVAPVTPMPAPLPARGEFSQVALHYLSATLGVLHREKINLPRRRVVHGQPARGARFLEIPVFLDADMINSLSMRKALGENTQRAIQAATGCQAVNAWQRGSSIIYQYELARRHWQFYKRGDLPRSAAIGLGVGRSLVPFELTDKNTLVAGETRSGKSVTIETILFAIMANYAPDEAGLVLLDPNQTMGVRKQGLKAITLGSFSNAAHLLRPVAYNYQEIEDAINFVYNEFRQRMARARHDAPGLVLVIDELMNEAVIGDKESGSLHEEHLAKISQIASQGIKFNIFVVAGAHNPKIGTTSTLLMRNLTQRLVGRVTDDSASRALAGRSGVNAHLLTGQGDFVQVVKENEHHLRFQVAEPTRADFDRLERRAVSSEPVEKTPLMDLPEPAPPALEGEILPPPLSDSRAGRKRVCVDPYTFALYQYIDHLSTTAARSEYGIGRIVHEKHKKFIAVAIEELARLKAGHPTRSPYFERHQQRLKEMKDG